MTSVVLIPSPVWFLVGLMGTLLAYAKYTQSKRMYKALWALAAITAFIIGFSLI
jgi:hypothetical protein